MTLWASAALRRGLWPASLAIRLAIEELGTPLQRIGLEQVRGVLALLERPSPCQVHLPHGLRASCAADKLVLERVGASPAPVATAAEHELLLPGRTVLPDGSAVETTVEDLPPSAAMDRLRAFLSAKKPGQELLDADRLAPPLVARHWRFGDRMQPLGGPGRQKLSDLLGALKVPAEDRWRLWVICDQLGPLWVAPHRIEHRVRVTELTRRAAILTLDAPIRGRP